MHIASKPRLQTVAFRLQLTNAQIDRLVSALMPDPQPEDPAKRFAAYLRRHSPIDRVNLMRHGKFRAHEIDSNLAVLASSVEINKKGKIPVYIWKEAENSDLSKSSLIHLTP